MKVLYYNPLELPKEIQLTSKILGIDKTYRSEDGNGPVYMEELFRLAAADSFDDVKVLLTANNEAYYRKTKKSTQKVAVDGWVSLKEYRNGGGYHNDKVSSL